MIKNAYKRYYLKGAGAEAEIPAPGGARLHWWLTYGGGAAPGKLCLHRFNPVLTVRKSLTEMPLWLQAKASHFALQMLSFAILKDFVQDCDSNYCRIRAVNVNLRLIRICGGWVEATGNSGICYGDLAARLNSICSDTNKYDICKINKILIFSIYM
jgi:hypothetical protein